MSVVINGSTGVTSPDFSGAGPSLTGVQAASGPNSSPFALRNKIINGDMNISQRGTSFAAIANATYCLDRWLFIGSNGAVLTASQQADVPSDNEFQNSLRLAVTTADTSIAAGEFAAIVQKIEGYNIRDLIGRTFTISFKVRSSKTGVHCVSLRNTGYDKAFVAEYTVNVANTWETKSVVVSGGLTTAGTWNWTTGMGLDVSWCLAAGSGLQTTANAWQSGNFLATANQVNCLDTIGNIFAITGVQLEAGAVATPFEHRPSGLELSLCLRYFIKQSIYYQANCKYASGAFTNGGSFIVSFPVAMRVAPTTTIAYTNYDNTTGIGDGSATVYGVQYSFTVANAGFPYCAGLLSSSITAEL